MNHKLKQFLQFTITVGLILYVCYSAGFFSQSGRAEFAAVLTKVDWSLVVLSVLVTQIHNLVSVLKWQLVVLAKRLKGNFFRLLNYLYVGRLYNLVLPSSMGGDVVRIYRLGKHNNNMELAAASVFVERFVGLQILLALAAFSLIFVIGGENNILFVLSFVFLLVVTLCLGWAAVDSRFVRLLDYFANRTGNQLLRKVVGKFDNFQQSIREVSKNKAFILKLFAYSLLFYFIAMLSVWVSAIAFDRDVSLWDMVIAVPVIMLIMNLPVSIGGLGLVEASYTVTFELMGYSAELGLITALLMRGKALLDALIGGIFEMFNSKEAGLPPKGSTPVD